MRASPSSWLAGTVAGFARFRAGAIDAGPYSYMSLKRHKAIQFDAGLEDGLLGVNRQLDALLTQAGIAHRFETYDGNHNNKVFERIETRVLPFFSMNLEFK